MARSRAPEGIGAAEAAASRRGGGARRRSDGVHATGERCASATVGEPVWAASSMVEDGLTRRAGLTARMRGRQRVRRPPDGAL